MKRVKIISRILWVISWILAALYLATVIYAVFCLVTGLETEPYGDGKYLHINYPFSSIHFLNIENNLPYIVCSFLLLLGFYGVFFLLAAGVFSVFFQPRLFTLPNIIRLRRFYWFNLIVPGAASISSSVFVSIESGVWALVLVHFLLGVFAYFLAAIFKQGLNLQNEQDLFI